MMPLSRLDKFYRSILLSKYFIKGWGNPDNLKRLLQFRKIVADRETCYNLVAPNYPVHITKEYDSSDMHILEGSFLSPFEIYMPGLLPHEAKQANFQMIFPKKWGSDHYKPVCLHMAGTGDHFFWRRRHIMAKPLLKEAGIGSVILENPFYGTRKPMDQVRSVLHNVSDIFVMGGCLILEALVIFHWCLREGLGPLGVTGMSMGGHMASLAATNWPAPIILVPCLSWSTASSVFTEGVMSHAINWGMLENQYMEEKVFSSEIQKMVNVIKVDAFHAGQQFAKNFPSSMSHFSEIEYNMKGIPTTDNFSKMDQISQELEFSDVESRKPAKAVFNFSLSDLMKMKLLNIDDKKFVGQTLNDKIFQAAKKGDLKWRQQEVLHFMKGIMDECTHLRNFSVPVDTSLITAVCAVHDGYVPREGVTDLLDIWPGAQVHYLNGGHVAAFLLNQKAFRGAIVDCFNRYKKKYIDSNGDINY